MCYHQTVGGGAHAGVRPLRVRPAAVGVGVGVRPTAVGHTAIFYFNF